MFGAKAGPYQRNAVLARQNVPTDRPRRRRPDDSNTLSVSLKLQEDIRQGNILFVANICDEHLIIPGNSLEQEHLTSFLNGVKNPLSARRRVRSGSRFFTPFKNDVNYVPVRLHKIL